MSSHLARRGGIWWARLVVPVSLRVAAGRREFIQSCRTHELVIAKLVASVLVADWRRYLLGLESTPMTIDVLKLVGGSPILSGDGWVPLSEAVGLSGISRDQLLRATTNGTLKLFGRVSRMRGYVVALEALEFDDVMAGRSGGVEIPPPESMPARAQPSSKSGVLPLSDPEAVASMVLAKSLEQVEIIAFAEPDQPGVIFAPDKVMTVDVGMLEVLVSEIEAIRQQLANDVRPEVIERAKTFEKAASHINADIDGKQANKLFSEALTAYANAPSGIPGDVVSLAEQRQKHRGCSLFIELVGDLPLHEVTADRLREFRIKLKSLPTKPNNIPKEYRRETMAATVQALKDGGMSWPNMTDKAQHERMLWLDQMFRWLVPEWLSVNPVALVASEQTKTAAQRKVEKQVKAQRKATGFDDDADDREPFTPAELHLIFNQPQYLTGNGGHVKGNEKWYPFEYWLPIISLHAGCRIKEVSQLHLRDIRQSEDRTWYFDINETSADKSLKNESAPRQIPVSPVLIDLGLIEYRSRLEAEGFKRLFPELTWAKSDAKYAKESGRKMSLMFERLGMPRDGTKVFHCLRANFNDAMLRVPLANLPFDNPKLVVFAQMKIFGHMVEDVNGKHYTSAAMSEKLRFVSGLRYDLPELTKFDIDFGIGQVRVAIDNKIGFRRGREDMGPMTTD